jgi:Na+/melibiose symporter-like transporter
LAVFGALLEMPQIDSDPSSTSRSATIQKQYQAFIVLIPVSIASIILLLFYFFYLRRGRGLPARRASLENNNDTSKVGLIIMFLSPFCVPFFTYSFLFVVKQLELGLRKDMTEMLPAVACKESFSSIDPQ